MEGGVNLIRLTRRGKVTHWWVGVERESPVIFYKNFWGVRRILIMRILIVLVALLIPVFAYAGPCGDYEYAELQDMDQESFLKEYCQVRKTGQLYAKLSMLGGKRKDKANFESCYQLLMKMERIYLRRFKIDNVEILRGKCNKQ